MIYHDKFLKRTQCGNTDPKFRFSLLRANVRERLFNVFLFIFPSGIAISVWNGLPIAMT